VSLLQVEGLRVRFDARSAEFPARAVDGVSYAVRSGEAVGLVGESGCGKTVSALAVMGLLPPPPGAVATGSVRFRGEELLGAPRARLRTMRGADMAMVFQDPMSALNPVLKVGAQLMAPLRRHQGMSAHDARARALDLLEEVGIPDPARCLGSYAHELSGGMCQRVMIAMALSCEPELLIADEPTTALDVTVQARVLELLARLRARREMGLLLVTHDLGVVAGLCDRVVVMYAGRVVEEGTVDDIFNRPRHPYTRGLLGSLPRLGDRRGRLRPIPGSVPSATAWPSACRFRPRCVHAWDRCEAEEPGLLAAEDEDSVDRRDAHLARCWLLEEPERDRSLMTAATGKPEAEHGSGAEGSS
jgi:oligopeptide/dipeptide ABC transporter ATP-binding protein